MEETTKKSRCLEETGYWTVASDDGGVQIVLYSYVSTDISQPKHFVLLRDAMALRECDY